MMAGCILWLRALPLLGGLGARPALRHHTQSAFVQVEQGLLLVVLLFVHSSDLDDLAHDLRLEAAAFGFGVDFLDIFAERALPLFESLDALDKRFELRTRDAPDIRHDLLSPLLLPPPTAAGQLPPASCLINATARQQKLPDSHGHPGRSRSAVWSNRFRVRALF